MLNLKRITTGFKDLDSDINYLRFGDIVTWNFSKIKQYKFMANAFAYKNKEAGERIIYIHFGEGKYIIDKEHFVKSYVIDIRKGFEQSAMEVYDIIDAEGSEVIYIFDSLTKLQEKWVADFMLANFFVVTAGEITKRNSSAYFSMKSGTHSFETISRIRNEATVIFELFSEIKNFYLLALAVRDRYNPKMFLPHKIEISDKNKTIDEFEYSYKVKVSPITNGIETAHFYSLIANTGNQNQERVLDSWERFFAKVHDNLSKKFIKIKKEKLETPGAMKKQFRNLLKLVFSIDNRMLNILEKNITLNDLLAIKSRMIGVGSIGGKATGMILARAIIKNKLPEVDKLLEPHDSFYICSNLYYTFLVKNNCWSLKLKQRMKTRYFPIAEILREKIMEGQFSNTIRENFIRMLQYFGKSPIIVRSSSLLEDGFGNAFPGKYESVFCVNSGSLNERLNEFETAIKTVYASTMSASVLEYRLKRNLKDKDEQMGLLVQRVSGSLFKDIYMPTAAGVCFSYNAYKWSPEIDPNAGVMRIVLGLGTRAVDRTASDYPRIAVLDKPDLVSGESEFISEQAQSKVDLLDLSINTLATVSLEKIIKKMSPWFKDIMVERDYRKEARLKELHLDRPIYYARCESIIKNEKFLNSIKKILKTIEKEYNYPVDIEFAVNIDKSGSFVINILQCRPLQASGEGIKREIPGNLVDKNLLFRLSGGTMGGAYYQKIDYIIQINPKKYYEYAYSMKGNIARIVGEINAYFKEKDEKIMLLSPGRIGTSSPELGVPVSFAEISSFNILCEVAYSGAGYRPELSFGSHFFLDIVESNIFYIALFENTGTTDYFNPSYFDSRKNIFKEILSDVKSQEIIDMVRIIDCKKDNIKIISDVKTGKTVCGKI
ncbi:MAG: PEP/pyruvate-binding domain-containing protein [Clostridiales Family XIII bacterium]|jgi:hypothetical protein|nr:PEP/pyruvate-binding domain-containing protein [Clostridiales Family XIII bacterium]